MNASIEWGSIPGWLQVVLVALAAVQISLQVYALVVLFRTPDERLMLGKKWPWALIIVFVNLVGAIVFLAAGRKPAAAVDPLAAGGAAAAGAAQPADRATRAAEVLYGPRGGEGA